MRAKFFKKTPSISTAMPCRISILNQGEKTVVMTVSSMMMLNMFNEPELEDVAREVETLMKEIIEASL